MENKKVSALFLYPRCAFVYEALPCQGDTGVGHGRCLTAYFCPESEH